MCAEENNKIRTKHSAQTHLLITELLMDINHIVWCVMWCVYVCVCVHSRIPVPGLPNAQ